LELTTDMLGNDTLPSLTLHVRLLTRVHDLKVHGLMSFRNKCFSGCIYLYVYITVSVPIESK